MSFLNPVNEPVLRFSSTDADAPQINYNSRVSGDVKAVLKACLVTGYGAKASAGWLIVNEVSHVAEFVSPSAAMSDYRLGINDTSASSTTWYYQYQDSRVDMQGSNISKGATGINTAKENGWEVMVSGRGIVLVEKVFSSTINRVVARFTYWGQVKSAIPVINGKNIAWYCVGHNTPANYSRATSFFSQADRAGQHQSLENLVDLVFEMPAKTTLAYFGDLPQITGFDLISALHLSKSNVVVAEQPAFMVKAKISNVETTGVYVGEFSGRPVMYVFLGSLNQYPDLYLQACHAELIVYLDYWEY